MSSSASVQVPLMLCGRESECQLLLQAYERSNHKRCSIFNSSYASSNDKKNENPPATVKVTETDTSRRQELVLIQGRSGTGKTSLAKSIDAQVIEKDSGFVLFGKFELSQVKKPYEVLVSCLENFLEVIGQLPRHDEGRTHRIHQALCEAIGTDAKVLTDMIPAVKQFIGPQHDADDDTSGYSEDDATNELESSDLGGKEALQKFQFAFSKLLRVLSSVVPLVLFLDDLQWSDPSSLSLLQMVLESESPPNQQSCLLVICAFRNEGIAEMDDKGNQRSEETQANEHPNYIRDFLRHVSSSPLINSTDIILENLDQESTNQLVAANLNAPEEISRKLGSIVYAKCNGNPFHAVQLLGPLIRQNLGRQQACGNVNRQWAWDEDDIFQISEAADTVDEMICQKLSTLSSFDQQVVMTAACMGNCIDHPALCTVFDGNVSAVEASLKIAVAEGFFVFDRKLGEYRFIHDRFRQATMSMIDDGEAKSFEIGHKLWTKATPMLLQTKLFLIVNLLNHGTKLMKDQDERYKAAAINLDAGVDAISMASFQDGARFLRSGMAFLEGGDHWNEQYDLSLRLYNAAADAEMCSQNSASVNELVGVIFEKARSVRDKLCAYVVLINSLGQHGRVEAATRVGIDVMRQLREPLPSKVTNLSLLFEIFKARMALRGRSNAELLTLPPMQDEDKIACIYVLTNLVTYSFQASSNYIVVISARLVRLCVKYGMHKCCAHGFVAFALVMCAFDCQEGYRLGRLALTMVERYRARELLPRVHMNFYGLVHHWKRPLEESLAPLENSYRVGMETGDVEYALNSLCFYLGHWLNLGKPLAQIENQLNEAARRMKLFRQDHILEVQLIFTQFIHNITGRAPIAQVLSGDASPLYDAARPVDSLLIPYFNYCVGAELAFLFGDFDLAGRLLDKKRALRFEPKALYHYSKMCFKEALICTSLARTDGPKNRSKNIRIAKSALKQMKAWARGCPPNYQHKHDLMEAELKSLGLTRAASMTRRHHVRDVYDRAIHGALQAGFLEEAMIANELAGTFAERRNDVESARTYFNEACNLSKRWGATEKTKQLSTKAI